MSSYYGRPDFDQAIKAVVDRVGFVYVAGWRERPGYGDADVFVIKLSPDGSRVVYETILAGSGYDSVFGLAVDPFGGIFVAGSTASDDFPIRRAFQPELNGNSDAWVAKLDSRGEIVWASYFGGTAGDGVMAMTTNAKGDVFLTGSTDSIDLPGATKGAQPRHAGGYFDAYVAKLRGDGRGVVFASYLGGTADETGWSVAVDRADDVYVVGMTGSVDFPTVLALQPTFGGSYSDAFVTKFSSDGRTLRYSTYLGGTDFDYARSAALDSQGFVYVTGATSSSDFPTRRAHKAILEGGDAFVAKLPGDGQSLVYSTFLGGSQYEGGLAVAVDSAGHVAVSGVTASADFPDVGGLGRRPVEFDGFVTLFSNDGQDVLSSTAIGGSDSDDVFSLAPDSTGSVWIAGRTWSTDYPTVNALQPSNAGGGDAFFSRIRFGPTIGAVTAVPSVLSPANRRMVEVGVEVTVGDAWHNEARCRIVSVASSDPTGGDGDKRRDWEIFGDLQLRLRAARTHPSLGRVYAITVECNDPTGLTARDVAYVTVPRRAQRLTATPDDRR
ncbi:MAG: SBBP repeat-containing protein [Vicinamibacterales bacterium]